MNRFAVVFDTNILFSGLGWQGSPYHCLQLARAEKVRSITCLEILNELAEKLQSKMGMNGQETARAVAEILTYSEIVKIENKLHVIQADPDDDKVLECATIGKADFIVSGDRHILALGKYQGILILQAETLLDRISV